MHGELEDGEYVDVQVADIGLADADGVEGVLILRANDGKELTMRSFSGEVAKHIARFKTGDRTSIPTIYKMIEELAEISSFFLDEVKIYQLGNVLRANLHFQGKSNSLILRNYRASDSVALAQFYDVSIKVRSDLLKEGDFHEGQA